MTTEEIIEHSKKTKRQADEILSSTNLIKTLEEFGEVLIHGSYPLDLMYGSDIDIIVVPQDIRIQSMAAIKKLLEQRLFQKYEYGDFVKFPRENRPQGFIIVLKTTVENIKWEVEIWFLTSSEKERENFNWIKERLNESNRIRILEAKHERETSGKSKHDLSSLELCKQILT